MSNDKELRKNGSGYSDPTAYKAIKKVDGVSSEENARFYNLLDTIFYIVKLAGFELEGRIALRDTKTGKIWR